MLAQNEVWLVFVGEGRDREGRFGRVPIRVVRSLNGEEMLLLFFAVCVYLFGFRGFPRVSLFVCFV